MAALRKRDKKKPGDPVLWRRVELCYRRLGANATAAVLVAAGPFLVFVSAHRLYLVIHDGRGGWGWRDASLPGFVEQWGCYGLAVALCTGIIMMSTASGLRCVIRNLRRLGRPSR